MFRAVVEEAAALRVPAESQRGVEEVAEQPVIRRRRLAERAQAQDRDEDLVLSAPTRARRIDVD